MCPHNQVRVAPVTKAETDYPLAALRQPLAYYLYVLQFQPAKDEQHRPRGLLAAVTLVRRKRLSEIVVPDVAQFLIVPGECFVHLLEHESNKLRPRFRVVLVKHRFGETCGRALLANVERTELKLYLNVVRVLLHVLHQLLVEESVHSGAESYYALVFI